MDNNVFKKVGNELNKLSNIGKKFSNLNSVNIPDYKLNIPNFVDPTAPRYKASDEVIAELEKDNYEPSFDNKRCYNCESKVNRGFLWYYLKSINGAESKVFCSYKCLKAFYEDNGNNLDEYEIIEYSRCTAYYKCKELGNLRNKCERVENLSYDNILINPINFCETAQAGIILASHKSYQVMNEFSKNTNNQLRNFDRMLKKFSIESDKQFKINTKMTILVILLTVVNLVVAILGYLSSTNDNRIDMIQENLGYIETKLDEYITDNSINKLDKRISTIETNQYERFKEIEKLINQLYYIIEESKE